MMIPTQNDVFAHQYDIASRQFKTLRRRFHKLEMAVSKSHNAVYGHADVLRVLSLMSDRKMFFRSAVTHLRRKASKYRRQQQHDGGTATTTAAAAATFSKKGGAYSSRTPHPEWILKTIRSVSPDRMQRWCNSMLQHTVRNGRRSGMLHNTDVVAVDVTDVEYYGKGLKDVARKSKPKNGTSTFLSHITVHGVGSDDGSDLVLSSLQLPKDAKLADFVPKMIRKASRSGTKIRMFLYDRGFFNVNCMVAAGKSQGFYVMPAAKNKRIKAAIEEHHHKKRDAISDYTMTNKEGKNVTLRLVIVKKEEEDENENENENNDTAKEECTEKKKEKKKETADEYLVFATNMPAKSVEDVIAQIPEEYRMRWGIETGFRVIKGVMGKTCSNSPVVRMLLFYMPLILYNLWRTAIFIDVESKWDGFAGGKDFTMMLFAACITDAADSFVNDRGK